MSNDDVLLDVRDLRVEGWADEKWNPIINGIDLTLKAGQVIGLIGESGAGKSTLGLAAIGFTKDGCRISGGSAVFDGIDLVKAGNSEKRNLWGTRLTYVAQSAAASFNPAHRLIDQTIATTVRDGLRPVDEAVEDAKKLYEALSLPNPETIGGRYPHQVSGGQLQRVMTAMAMEPRPKIIVFDEPTTALDVTTQVDVLLSMRKAVRDFNAAAIYITHDLAVVAQMADVIKVLRYGEEVEEADTRKMLTAPKEDYTRSLWSVRMLGKEPKASDDIVLSVDGVDAAYGSEKVLHDISIRLPHARTVSIVGESGSGKSTVARVVTGLLPPSKGQVAFKGVPLPPQLRRRDKNTLRRIQMIYQMADVAMNPRQTVGEIIGRPLEFYHGLKSRAQEERVIELLKEIDLNEEFYDRFPAELSGGQKQRICIARALAANPEIIICDEVTSALDQIVQEGILKLLMRLQKEKGIAYLFITHDIATVAAISDEIVVMNKGAVVEQGSKTDVLRPPHPEYTQLLLSSVPEMDPDWLTGIEKQRT